MNSSSRVVNTETQNELQFLKAHHLKGAISRSLDELFGTKILNNTLNENDYQNFLPVQQPFSINATETGHHVQVISVPRYVNNVIEAPILPKRDLPPIVHDISFIDKSIFSRGCLVCQLQFKHVYRDYVISEFLLKRNDINVGEFLVTISHLDSKTIDLGIVTALYTVDEFLQLKRLLGRSQDQEENFIGTVIRVATMDERSYLPPKWEREVVALQLARQISKNLSLDMDIYCAEFQLDGKILYLYYTADSRVDYRGLVHEMTYSFANVRVKMKKTNQCRKFIPHEYASVGLATGYLP